MGAAFCIMLVITPRLQAVLLCCGWMEVCAASLAYGKSVVGVEVQHAATASQQKGRAFASNDQHQCQPPEGGPFMAVARAAMQLKAPSHLVTSTRERKPGRCGSRLELDQALALAPICLPQTDLWTPFCRPRLFGNR